MEGRKMIITREEMKGYIIDRFGLNVSEIAPYRAFVDFEVSLYDGAYARLLNVTMDELYRDYLDGDKYINAYFTYKPRKKNKTMFVELTDQDGDRIGLIEIEGGGKDLLIEMLGE